MSLAINTIRLVWILLLSIDLGTGLVRASIGIQNPFYLFIGAVVFSIFGILQNNEAIKVEKEERYLITISMILFGVGLWGSFVGSIRGNDMQHIVNDSAAFLFYPAWFLLWIGVFSRRLSIIANLNRLIFWYVFTGIVIALLYLIILGSFPSKLSVFLLGTVDNSHVNVFGNYVQIFFISLSLLVPLVFAILSMLVGADNVITKLFLLLLVLLISILIIISYVRVYWLLLPLGLLGYSLLFERRNLFVVIALVAVVVGVGSLSIGGINLSDVMVNRIQTMFDSTQSSNQMKLRQISYLWKAVMEHPILGNGYGMRLEFVRSSTVPYVYEVDLLALIAKLGLVAFLVLCGLLLWALSEFIQLFKFYKFRCLRYESSVAFFGGFSLLYWVVIDLTNPYLNSPLGIAYIYFVLAILTLLRKRRAELGEING